MKKEKHKSRTYVVVPNPTQDVDGSVIVESGIIGDGNRKHVAYFGIFPSQNGSLEERKKTIKVPGYIIDAGRRNKMGNIEYQVSPVPEEEQEEIELIGRQRGLVGKFEFWK